MSTVQAPFDGIGEFRKRWYIAKVEPQRERAFREEMARIERPFLVFLPMEVPRLGKSRDGKPCVVNADRLRFPGYGFVAMDLLHSPEDGGDDWGRVRRAKYVSHLLGGEEPLPVVRSIMDRLIASDIAYSRVTVDDLLIRQRRAKAQPLYAKGDVVRFATGAWEGVLGHVSEDDGDTLKVLTGMLEVTVSHSQVRAA